jgi:polyhydroxybutyrate depolymerase
MRVRPLATVVMIAAVTAAMSCVRPWGIEHMPLMGGPGPHSAWLRVSVPGAESSSVSHIYSVDLHTPPRRNAEPTPLVIVLHGYGGTGPGMERRTRFSEAGDSAGFAVAYPNAQANAQGKRAWSGASPLSRDVLMLRALIDSVAARVPIDRRRVYLAGFSNGGGMTYRAALALPNTFAAIGVVAGVAGPAVNEAAMHGDDPGPPLVAVHGVLDRTVPYGPAVLGSVRRWAQRNGCSLDPLIDTLPGQDAVRTTYASCSSGSVTLYAMQHGGHGWPTPSTREAPLSTTGVFTRFFMPPRQPRAATGKQMARTVGKKLEVVDVYWRSFPRPRTP